MSGTTEDKAARAYRNSESAALLTRKRRICEDPPVRGRHAGDAAGRSDFD
jgi:hypothetical protein